jgi:hypothetical protein
MLASLSIFTNRPPPIAATDSCFQGLPKCPPEAGVHELSQKMPSSQGFRGVGLFWQYLQLVHSSLSVQEWTIKEHPGQWFEKEEMHEIGG